MNRHEIEQEGRERGSGSRGGRVNVTFIAGAARSGSTLLERILGNVKSFFPAGELIYIWKRGFQENQLCSCGAPFHECEFWTAVVAEAFGRREAVDASEMLALSAQLTSNRRLPQLFSDRLRSEASERALERYVQTLDSLYQGIARTSGSTTLVDSSKSLPYVLALSSVPSVDVFLIHLVRDSRAVAYSWLRKKIRPEITWKREYMPRSDVWQSALRWNRTNLVAEAVAGRFPNTRVRYEDVAADPAATTDRVVRRIARSEESAGVVQDGFVHPPSRYHSISGNPIRFQQQPLEIRSDTEWETQMARSSKAVVTAVTLPLLLRYGYSVAR